MARRGDGSEDAAADPDLGQETAQSLPRMPPPPRAVPDQPTGLALALAAQFVALVASVLVAALFLLRRDEQDNVVLRPGVGPIVWSLLPLWAVLLGAVILHERARSGAPTIGLNVRWTDALYALLGPVLQFAGALLYLPFNVDAKRLEKPARDLVDQAGSIGVGFWILAAALVIGAPIVEELFYRGLVLGALRRAFAQTGLDERWITVAAVVACGVWFGAIHFEWLQFPVLALVGMVGAVLVVRTRRIAPAVFLHIGFNALSVAELGRQLSRK